MRAAWPSGRALNAVSYVAPCAHDALDSDGSTSGVDESMHGAYGMDAGYAPAGGPGEYVPLGGLAGVGASDNIVVGGGAAAMADDRSDRSEYDRLLPSTLVAASGTSVDFSQAAIFLPGLQALAALAGAALAAILGAWVSDAFGSRSAVRALLLAAACATACLWTPWGTSRAFARRKGLYGGDTYSDDGRLQRDDAGVSLMFDALRPSVAMYLAALVAEQLARSCTSGGGHDAARAVLVHAAAALMLLAGCAQAHAPRAPTDYPFAVTALALGAVGLLGTSSAQLGAGPLCVPPATGVAVERVFRALLFGLVYAGFAYACEPKRHSLRAVLLCAVRAGGGAVWVLVAHRYVLPCALPQFALLVWARMHDAVGASPHETLPLRLSDASSGVGFLPPPPASFDGALRFERASAASALAPPAGGGGIVTIADAATPPISDASSSSSGVGCANGFGLLPPPPPSAYAFDVGHASATGGDAPQRRTGYAYTEHAETSGGYDQAVAPACGGGPAVVIMAGDDHPSSAAVGALGALGALGAHAPHAVQGGAFASGAVPSQQDMARVASRILSEASIAS